MSEKHLISICVLTSLLIPGHSYAIDIHWTEVASTPDYIVIGTLSVVEHECFKAPGFPIPNGEQFMVYDCGWIEVEELLLGMCDIERLPIGWISYIIESSSPNVKHYHAEICEEHDVGDRYIWILWNRYTYKDPKAAYYGFKEMPLDSLPNVQKEIARIQGQTNERRIR